MRAQRWLGLVVVVVLGLGLVGCGGDDSGGDDGGTDDTSSDDDGSELDSSEDTEAPEDTATDETEPSETTEAPEGGEPSGGSTSVEAYCDAVADYVEQAQDAIANPADADLSELTEAGNELAEQAAQIDVSDPADGQRLLECSQAALDALNGG